jgi:uncharacterized membrane protein
MQAAAAQVFPFRFEFYQILAPIHGFFRYFLNWRTRTLAMPTIHLLRAALWAMCVVLGSCGVFFAITSWSVPGVSGDAVVLLGAALGINYFLKSSG